jgi:hypothetical protein
LLNVLCCLTLSSTGCFQGHTPASFIFINWNLLYMSNIIQEWFSKMNWVSFYLYFCS